MTISGRQWAMAGSAALVALALLRAGQHPAERQHMADCKAADFPISGVTASRSFETATLSGNIASRCAEAAAVRLLWTQYNPDGTVSTFPFYAHDGQPIRPGESYMFTTSAQVQTGRGARYRITVDAIAPG